MRATYAGNFHVQNQMRASELCPISRIANIIHLHNIIPRGGHYNVVLPYQLFLCNVVVSHRDLNLGHILFNVMANVSMGKVVLPYGMVFTCIFKHFHIPLTCETKGSKLSPINASSLTKMGLAVGDVGEEGQGE